jgi:hypothetical protein
MPSALCLAAASATFPSLRLREGDRRNLRIIQENRHGALDVAPQQRRIIVQEKNRC